MTTSLWGKQKTQFFYQLGPEVLLKAVDKLSIQTTGHWFFLNSMENRVVQIEVEGVETPPGPWSKKHVIGKFYRPGRWQREQLLEEHRFTLELQKEDIPVVAPLVIDGETLFEVPDTGIFYCLFPCLQGRSPDELLAEDYKQLGRLMARLHNQGAKATYQQRLTLDASTFGRSNLSYLKSEGLLPSDMWPVIDELSEQLFAYLEREMRDLPQLRLHGDCHRGNLLRAQDQFYLVDFDDTISGPVIQDLWPLLPAHPHECPAELAGFLEGYESFRPFPREQMKLINPLRMLRYFHFAGWLARRWEDPSFKQAFPYFGDNNYWRQWMGDLHQLSAMSFGAKAENDLGDVRFYDDDDDSRGNC